jgi:phenylacetate-CoA ligase
MNVLSKIKNQIIANYHLHNLRKNQWKKPLELRRAQLLKLKAIIKYAYEYVPFYHRLMQLCKTKPDHIKSLEDLKKIPPISKQDVLENYQDFIASGIDVSKLSSGFTSGSTGPTIRFYYDSSYASFLDATTRFPFFECGAKLNDNFVTIWGRESHAILFSKKYATLLGGLNNTIVPLFPPEKLIKVLKKIKPDVLWTFPSVLCTLANYNISDVYPRLVFTQGEIVTRHCRYIVNRLFNSELFETYGSVEFGHIAFECSEHCGLHTIEENCYLEFVDESGEYVSPGERGEIIVTGLWNRAMPLIRYRIGDFGIPTDEKCPCGRSWSLIKKIQGRTNDCLVLPSGKKIPAGWLYFERIIDRELKKNVFCVTNYQLVQDRRDRIIIKYIKGRDFNPKIIEKIKNDLEIYFAELGEKLEIVMQAVSEIQTGRTGKKLDFISLL